MGDSKRTTGEGSADRKGATNQEKVAPLAGRPNRNSDRTPSTISIALPCGRLCYGEPKAINYAKFCGRVRDGVVCDYEFVGNVIERFKPEAISRSSRFAFSTFAYALT